jgi:hypothetical protein
MCLRIVEGRAIASSFGIRSHEKSREQGSEMACPDEFSFHVAELNMKKCLMD